MLELTFDVSPDKNGMINGLDLACQLFTSAAALINPYVNKCPGCLDQVFSYLANAQLGHIHKAMRTPGVESQGLAVVFCLAPPEKKDQVIREHLEASKEFIKAIIEGGSEHQDVH